MDRFLAVMSTYGYSLHEHDGNIFTFVKVGIFGRSFIVFHTGDKTIHAIYTPIRAVTCGADVVRIGTEWDETVKDCSNLAKLSNYRIM